jgi:hypothetical protein
MSDTVTGMADVASVGERNECYSERHGGHDVGERKKQVMQSAARRARRQREKETSDKVSGTAVKESSRARNERFSEGRGAQVLDR